MDVGGGGKSGRGEMLGEMPRRGEAMFSVLGHFESFIKGTVERELFLN